MAMLVITKWYIICYVRCSWEWGFRHADSNPKEYSDYENPSRRLSDHPSTDINPGAERQATHVLELLQQIKLKH